MSKLSQPFQKAVLVLAMMYPSTSGSAQSAANDYEFVANFDGKKVAVDCDLLDRSGGLTPQFVAQLDPFGHYNNPTMLRLDRQTFRIKNGYSPSREELIDVVTEHLKHHGVTSEKVKAVAAHCNANYAEKYAALD